MLAALGVEKLAFCQAAPAAVTVAAGKGRYSVVAKLQLRSFTYKRAFPPLLRSSRHRTAPACAAAAAGPQPSAALQMAARPSLSLERFDAGTEPAERSQNGPESSGGLLPAPRNSPWQLVVALCAVGIFISYADRSNISIAVISMASDFGWDKTLEGWVLASFFLGYSATQLAGGQLADAYGGKPVLAAGLGLWSAATFLTPAAAQAGLPQLLLCRVALGLGEGVAFPAVHSIISRNVPPASQSSAVGLVTAASYAGASLAFLVVPPLIASAGWPAAFQAFGAAALLWLPLWLPLRLAGGGGGAAPARSLREAAAELAPLLRTRPVAAICVAQYCGSWGLYGLISWLPTFFSERYGVPLEGLPALTVAPYALQALVGLAVGAAADRALAAGAPRRALRVRLQAAGMLIPAACLLAAASPLAAGSAAAGSVLIDLGLAGSALTLAGVSVSHLDVAPRHAGAVFGAGNTAATLAGLVAVPATGALLDATRSWPLVFAVIAAHYLVGAAAFAAWAGDAPLAEDG